MRLQLHFTLKILVDKCKNLVFFIKTANALTSLAASKATNKETLGGISLYFSLSIYAKIRDTIFLLYYVVHFMDDTLLFSIVSLQNDDTCAYHSLVPKLWQKFKVILLIQ